MPEARSRSDAKMSWQECLDAGMTAPEAAQVRGVNRTAAYKWETKTGKQFRRCEGTERFDARREKTERIAKLAASRDARAVSPAAEARRRTPIIHDPEINDAINAAFDKVFGGRW